MSLMSFKASNFNPTKEETNIERVVAVYMVYKRKWAAFDEIDVLNPIGIFNFIKDAIEARDKEPNSIIYRVTMKFDELD